MPLFGYGGSYSCLAEGQFDVPLLGPRQNGNRIPRGGFYEQGMPGNGLPAYWLLVKCSSPYLWGRGTFNSIKKVKSFKTGISSLVHAGEVETTFSLPWHWILENWNLFHFIDLNQSGITCLPWWNQICRNLATWHNYDHIISQIIRKDNGEEKPSWNCIASWLNHATCSLS